MVLGSVVLMVLGSLITPRPSAQTLARYFPARENRETPGFAVGAVAR